MPGPAVSGVEGSLILMRHGETEWNRARRVMGQLPVPLNETGLAQCRASVTLLGGLDIRRIVSSPLMRARESADVVAAALGIGIDTDPGLSEVNFGVWTGRLYDDLRGTPEYQRYRANPLGNAPPGGETLAAAQARGVAAMARVLASPCNGRTLIVSHGDLIRSLLCHFLGLELPQYRRLRVDNCSVSCVEIDAGRPRLQCINVVVDPRASWTMSRDRIGAREL